MKSKKFRIVANVEYMTSYFGRVLALCGNWLCTLLAFRYYFIKKNRNILKIITKTFAE